VLDFVIDILEADYILLKPVTKKNDFLQSMFRFLVFASLFSLTNELYAQQLIINEVSQGTGSSEYVEFVVIGSPTCATPVPSLDLRKVIIDDNNGFFASGSGTGIASGAVRFANISFWQSVPQGTYIVIYNATSPNPSLPADDVSLTDGNCRLIIPSSSNLLEKTTVSPTTATAAYPPDADWTIGGSWAPLAMSNTDDSFQVPTIPSTGVPFHSVSWGNNINNTIIYFSGSAGGKVFSFTNNTNNNWNTQANWTAGAVGLDETPGSANNAANDAWIGSMNPQCSINPGLTVTPNSVNESCQSACDGSISVTVSNGLAPYSYLWSTGATTPSISNLCAGNYSIEVTGANGCSATEQITINPGVANADASILSAGPFANTANAQQISAVNSGGTWLADCGACLSSTGIFNPQVAGIGTWQICYELGDGPCSDVQCINVQVTDGCVPQTTNESITICAEDSVNIFGTWEQLPGNYSHLFTDINGCDSTHIVTLSLFVTNPINETIHLCEFDSVQVFNQWIFDNAVLNQLELSANGCELVHTVHVVLENCFITPSHISIPNVFTPNSDLVNDIFEITVEGGIIEKGFVLNRWGNVVAEFNANKVTWDGLDQANGLPVHDGVYTYIIYFKPSNSKEEVYQGFVTVIK
jgi:gliding motility-associated-like protein